MGAACARQEGRSLLQRLEKGQVFSAGLCLCLIAIAAWPRTATYNVMTQKMVLTANGSDEEEEEGWK
jgi:hypothetical protein